MPFKVSDKDHIFSCKVAVNLTGKYFNPSLYGLFGYQFSEFFIEYTDFFHEGNF